jgi:hypothetical protein
MTLTPSYGRDYKSAKAVKADFEAGKDFTIASIGPDMGRQCSIRDLKGKTVTLRYAKLTKCVVVEV